MRGTLTGGARHRFDPGRPVTEIVYRQGTASRIELRNWLMRALNPALVSWWEEPDDPEAPRAAGDVNQSDADVSRAEAEPDFVPGPPIAEKPAHSVSWHRSSWS